MNISTDWIQAICAVATFFLTIYLAWKNKDLQELIEVMKKQVSLLEKYRREEIMPRFTNVRIYSKTDLFLENENPQGFAKNLPDKILIHVNVNDCSNSITANLVSNSTFNQDNIRTQRIKYELEKPIDLPNSWFIDYRFSDKDGNPYQQVWNSNIHNSLSPSNPEPIDG